MFFENGECMWMMDCMSWVQCFGFLSSSVWMVSVFWNGECMWMMNCVHGVQVSGVLTSSVCVCVCGECFFKCRVLWLSTWSVYYCERSEALSTELGGWYNCWDLLLSSIYSWVVWLGITVDTFWCLLYINSYFQTQENVW